MLSNFDSMIAENGLKIVIWKIPTTRVQIIAGNKNCQIETPADLETTISLAFANRQKANIAPNKTVNGKIVSARCGNLNKLICRMIAIVASSFPDARRIISTRSNSSAIPIRMQKTLASQNAYWRPRYADKVSDSRTKKPQQLCLLQFFKTADD